MSTRSRNQGIRRAVEFLLRPASVLAFLAWFLLVGLLFAYVGRTGAAVTSTRHTLLPFVWIVASIWLVVYLYTSGPPRLRPRLGAAVAVGYLFLLSYVGGVVDLTTANNGLTVTWATPGWGPIISYSNAQIAAVLIPFEVIGYLALTYAVYRAVAGTSRGAVAGLLGLFSCISCVIPVFAAVAGIFGGSSVALSAGSATYDLATGVFVLTVVLLAVTAARTSVSKR
ncbi:DUF7546 family protein [Halovenus marina]|uniref:DUF7546 family protein n=1 Tax=Halovenus marina TaxID=3396621 RepID=UPI003F548F70